LLFLSAILLLVGGALTCASCQEGENEPQTRVLHKPTLVPGEQDDEEASDVLSALRWEGFVTYVRYTYLTPTPWPQRTVAWLDFENDRSRSWSIQTTDSATKPYVYDLIRDGDQVYLWLPALIAIDVGDEGVASLEPPLRRGSKLKITQPFSDWSLRLALAGEPTGTDIGEWPAPVRGFGWTASPVDAPADLPWPLCADGDEPEGYSYQYNTDMGGTPVVEALLASCDGEEQFIGGILYHEIGFIDPDDLPPDFFDPEAARHELVADGFSAFTALYGTPYWLGFESGPYVLGDVVICGDRCLEMDYLPSGIEDIEDVEDVEDVEEFAYPPLVLQVDGSRWGCQNEQSLEPEVPGARLCSHGLGEQWVLWDLPDFNVTLLNRHWTFPLSRDDFIAVARNLRPYDGPTVSGRPPILTMEEARDLVADSLDLVCNDQWTTIREYCDSAVFEYDEAAGEWRGQFGPLGEWAVTDPGKPVAWPVVRRESVEEDGINYPASYAECAVPSVERLREEEEAAIEAQYLEQFKEEQGATGSALVSALMKLRTFRYRIALREKWPDQEETARQFEGEFVAPDRVHQRPVDEEFGEELGTITIGDREWMWYPNGWEESSLPPTPLDWLGPFGEVRGLDVPSLQQLGTTAETVNGVPALRYEIERADVLRIGSRLSGRSVALGGRLAKEGELPPTFHATLWLAEDGAWPVRLVILASGPFNNEMVTVEYTLDITDVNDPTITIEPPLP
jgi:hypothetical protein